jgi:anthranilate phosphoribosyltransferase
LKPVLAALAEGRPLTSEEAETAFRALMSGEALDAEVGAFLMGLRVRGESMTEIAAGATVMRERATPVVTEHDVVDTCGTGGDAAGTFNISTAAALVAAAAGAKVAKHGNRAVSSKSGSSEVLAALGVNIEASPEVVARCIDVAGVGFLYAPAHHAAMRHVAGARKALGLRTIFNMIGPLANPAGARRQLLGVYDPALLRPMAAALKELGAVRALVVHGSDGLDEITSTGPTRVAALAEGEIAELKITPEAVGIERASLHDLKGGGPEENAAAIRDLLEGAPGPYRDIVVLNAGAALQVAELADTWEDGVAAAQAAIDDGRAAETLRLLVVTSNTAP